jgi:ParB family transcriptional regulator, chromosome partitioning protein
MNATAPVGFELDLHRLERPYAHTRLQRPEQVRRLMHSLEVNGQQVPLLVLGQGARFLLLDGYQRWAALTRLGRDTARVEVWSGELALALVQLLARHQGRAFEPIEQAWLVAAALTEGLTQRAVASALGKDPSWVSRRLALLAALSEPLQEAVRQGVVSTWAASRVLVPLARANAAEADRFLGAPREEPLSTRELATWYRHYGAANSTARARMLAHPRLFIQALQAPTDSTAAAAPEAQWLEELTRVRRQLQHLARRLGALLDPSPPPTTWAALRLGVAHTAQALERLRQPLEEGEHVERSATPDDSPTAGQGNERAPDQPHPRAQSAHGAPGAQRGGAAAPAPADASRAHARAHLEAARALLRESRQCGADAGTPA